MRYARSELDTVYKCFESNFKGIFLFENLGPTVNGMVKCKNSEITWHADLLTKKSDDKFEFQETPLSGYEREYSKIKYLKENILQALNDHKNHTLFIYKSNIANFLWCLILSNSSKKSTHS